LRSPAASNDTSDVLIPSYVSSGNDVAFSHDKKRFMYIMFTNIIRTTYEKNCVREASTTLDAQKVYASLLDMYDEHLSAKISAT
jgi:hypothetical protein